MLKLCYGFALCVFLAAPVLANDAPPSDESIQALLDLTDAKQLIAGVQTQLLATMEGTMQQSIQQALKGRALTPRQQAIVDATKAKMVAILDDMLSWDKLQPMYFRLYRQSFTQDDVDGITAFYRTPPGQAMLTKMPLLMRNMMGEMQSMYQPVQQRIMEVAQDAARQLQEPDPTPATNTG